MHHLNVGINIKEIEKLEKNLNIKLPCVYKCFLQQCNGGELFAIPAGTIISEINVSGKKKGSFLNETFREERRWPNMPKDYLIIAETNYGDTICMDLSTNNGNEAEIIKWDHENGEVSDRWNSFIDWLMEELDIGAMAVNYDRIDKE